MYVLADEFIIIKYPEVDKDLLFLHHSQEAFRVCIARTRDVTLKACIASATCKVEFRIRAVPNKSTLKIIVLPRSGDFPPNIISCFESNPMIDWTWKV